MLKVDRPSDFEESGDDAVLKENCSSNCRTSTSESERQEVGNSDSDGESVGIFAAKPKVYRDESGNRSSKTQENESYDREAILRRLANLENSYLIKYVTKTERLRENAASEDSLETSEPRYTNQEDEDDENPRSKVERLREALQAVPDSMLHLLAGANRPGDCGRPSDLKPDWLDEEKLWRGQKFAQDYMFPVFYATILSVLAFYTFEDSLKPIIITGKTSTPFTAFKRYLSTLLRFRNWYTQDLWVEGTTAWKDIKTVRAMHAFVRRRLERLTTEEIDTATKIPNAWCPTRKILLEDFSESCQVPAIGQCPLIVDPTPDRPKGISQTDMALTQWIPVGLIISCPKSFGIHYAQEEDLEAFCHVWRSIGYQLGIEDEFNFCRGTLEDVQHRSRDFLEAWLKPNFREITPEWEHATRCLMSGMSGLLPGINYEIVLLHLTELMGFHMPRFYASVSYRESITYTILKSLLNHGMKLLGALRFFNFMMNFTFDRAAKLTPVEIGKIRNKLSTYPGSDAKLTSWSPLLRRRRIERNNGTRAFISVENSA